MKDQPHPGQTYTASGRVRAGGEATFETHGLSTRFDGTAGRVDDLPGPADLLCASLCACILKNVERFSQILPFRYEAARVSVTAERQDSPPQIVRVSYELRVATDEPVNRGALLHKNIRTFGTITNTLARACVVDGTLHLERPDGQIETTSERH